MPDGRRKLRFTERTVSSKPLYPLVRKCLELRQEYKGKCENITEEAGISSACPRQWKRGYEPKLFKFDTYLRAMGYRLDIVPLGEQD